MKSKTIKRKQKEWTKNYIQCEVQHGTPEKRAEKYAQLILTNIESWQKEQTHKIVACI